MGAVEQPLLLQRHRITVDAYYRMAEAGVLAPDARVELIDGQVIDMAAMNSRHAGVTNEICRRLHEVLGRRAVSSCQTPLRLSDRSEPEPEPEPDLTLHRFSKPLGDAYADHSVAPTFGTTPLPGFAGVDVDLADLLP